MSRKNQGQLPIGLLVAINLILIGLVAFFLFSKPGQQPTPPAQPEPVITANAQPVSIGAITGSATISRNGQNQQIAQAEKEVAILPNDRIILAKGETCQFNYPDGRKVKFSGEGEYFLQTGEIKIVRGGMAVSFTSSPKGYKVHLPTATLGIRGTLLYIKVEGNYEWVFVDEGCIEWENTASNEKGVLNIGQGVKIQGKTTEAITQSPFCEPTPTPSPTPVKPEIKLTTPENTPKQNQPSVPSETSTTTSAAPDGKIQPLVQPEVQPTTVPLKIANPFDSEKPVKPAKQKKK